MPVTQVTPSPNGAKVWSSEDEAKLWELRSKGSPWTVVAKALGRTQASCESRFAALRKRNAASHTKD
ncbi:Myb-like DNA-binding domain-containing protein [Bradyrhizobium sp. USDA 4449]